MLDQINPFGYTMGFYVSLVGCPTTLATLTLIILFSKILRFSKKNLQITKKDCERKY
jgi:S-ribosylhomocysteine lyase LuxS involved in autoinducer biosynthesis